MYSRVIIGVIVNYFMGYLKKEEEDIEPSSSLHNTPPSGVFV